MKCIYVSALSNVWYPAILNSFDEYIDVLIVVNKNGLSVCGSELELIAIDGSTDVEFYSTFNYSGYISNSSGLSYK